MIKKNDHVTHLFIFHEKIEDSESFLDFYEWKKILYIINYFFIDSFNLECF